MKEKAEKFKKKERAERKKILHERNLQRQRDSDAIKRAREQEQEMEMEYKRLKGAEANAVRDTLVLHFEHHLNISLRLVTFH
jgi:hypothetical protein